MAPLSIYSQNSMTLTSENQKMRIHVLNIILQAIIVEQVLIFDIQKEALHVME